MRKKPMRWLAAGMALCLTLVTTPAASAAQPPQDTPVFEEIVPYSLYIKNQGCDPDDLRQDRIYRRLGEWTDRAFHRM